MGGIPNAPGPSPTLGSLGPSHQWHHKSRASLRGPPCAHGVAGTPQGEVRDRWQGFREGSAEEREEKVAHSVDNRSLAMRSATERRAGEKGFESGGGERYGCLCARAGAGRPAPAATPTPTPTLTHPAPESGFATFFFFLFF